MAWIARRKQWLLLAYQNTHSGKDDKTSTLTQVTHRPDKREVHQDSKNA